MKIVLCVLGTILLILSVALTYLGNKYDIDGLPEFALFLLTIGEIFACVGVFLSPDASLF